MGVDYNVIVCSWIRQENAIAEYYLEAGGLSDAEGKN
jgi:hypothetical protein